jgi:diguanylate cyclase (GGDEF)-like protein
MIEALQADACTISRWEPEADRVVTERDYVRCPDMHLLAAGTAYPLSEYPVTRRVIESREAAFLRASDPQVDEGERRVMQSYGAGMMVILPLAAGREAPVYGVVELYRKADGRNFSENELELARNLAAQAAQAIENARLFAEVQRLAVMDELTGLYNRRGFFELGRREHERAMRYHHALSAIFLDIDHFKLFNDAFSYAVGDQALRLVANCLRETTRETDLIGRYGGEEFVALLPETDLKAALRVAERVRKAVGQMRVKTGWGDVNLTVSIGVRQSSEETPTLDHLIDYAGQSLHTAKEGGRNRVVAG